MDRNGLMLRLVALQTVIIALSNWLAHFKWTIMGNPLSAAVWCTPVALVATDLTVRLLGKELARSVTLRTLWPGMLLTVAALMAWGGTATDIIRVTIASGVSWCLPVLLDISIFNALRQKYSVWWMAPGISGAITAAIMTYVFWGLAFAHGENQFLSDNWYVIATNQIAFKIVMNLVLLLPLYKLLLDRLQARMQP